MGLFVGMVAIVTGAGRGIGRAMADALEQEGATVLRADLAENEAAFKAQGYPIKVETIQCPNCGGTLELGMDKCEYCGQVLLS